MAKPAMLCVVAEQRRPYPAASPAASATRATAKGVSVAAFQLVLIVLAAVCTSGLVTPFAGWGVARLTRHYTDPLQQLVLSLLCGNSLLFALEAGGFIFGAPTGVVTAAAVVIVLASSALFVADVRRGRVRVGELMPGLLAWLGLSLLILAGAGLLVVQGVPGMYWDWWEHYYRSLFFALHLPPQTPVGGWSFAARAPMFNAVAALLMQGMGAPAYWKFLIVAVVLNSQVVLPLALLLRQMSGLPERAALVVAAAALFVAPFFNWNLTLGWPKMATTAWVLAALSFALSGLRSKDARLVGWGVYAMAAAFLSHYLAALYAAVMLPWLIYYARSRRLAVRPLVTAAGIGLALSAGWMAYLVGQFGWEGVLRANSTLGTSYDGWPEQLKGKVTVRPNRLELIGWNFASAVTPVGLRELPLFDSSFLEAPLLEEVRHQPDGGEPVHSRRHGQVFWVGVLDAAIGWTGIVLLVAATAAVVGRALRTRALGEFSAFWIFLVAVGIPVNLWSLRWYSLSGVLVNSFQPYLCLAVVLVAGWLWTLPRWWRIGLCAAWLLECAGRTAYLLWAQTRSLPIDGAAVEVSYIANLKLKGAHNVVMPRDLLPDTAGAVAVATGLAVLGLACFIVAARKSPFPSSK